MEKCIFCKIIKEEIDAARVWEDDKFLAILDVFPNTKGMTLVIPKEHHDTYIGGIPDTVFSEFLLAAKKVAKILEKAFDVKKVAFVIEGTGVNHAHVKLYPLRGSEEEFKDTWPTSKVCFEKYEGYVSTQHGPQADLNELKKIAEKIKQKNK